MHSSCRQGRDGKYPTLHRSNDPLHNLCTQRNQPLQRCPRRKRLVQWLRGRRKSQQGRADNSTRCNPSESQEGMLSNWIDPHAKTSPLDMFPASSILNLDRTPLAGMEGKKPDLLRLQRIQEGKGCKRCNWRDKMFLQHKAQAPNQVCRTCLEDTRYKRLRFALNTTPPHRPYTHLLLPLKKSQPHTAVERWVASHTLQDSMILQGTLHTVTLPDSSSSPLSIVSSLTGRPLNRTPRDMLAEAGRVHKSRLGGTASSGFDSAARRILEHSLCM